MFDGKNEVKDSYGDVEGGDLTILEWAELATKWEKNNLTWEQKRIYDAEIELFRKFIPKPPTP